MASQQAKSSQQLNPYLSPNQQDLLFAALNSQATTDKPRAKAADGDTGSTNRTTSDASHHHSTTMSANAVFQSPANMDEFNPDFTPDLDYLDADASFDFDNADLGGEMIGGLPGFDANGNPEQHDKRKNTDDDGSPEEGDAKRQELGEGERGSKKPGRKPLTNEPTTVSLHFLLAKRVIPCEIHRRVRCRLCDRCILPLGPYFPEATNHLHLATINIKSPAADYLLRNAKHRIVLRNAHSGSAKRNISKI